ncbi:MAG: DUF4358 domain-containing protein [Clostridia bacterium]|nr:DUF4358 domain-containing protein [Clostridia bacterium]
MKRTICILLLLTMLSACAAPAAQSPAPAEPTAEAETTPYAQRVIDAWKAAGYLENMAPYSEADLLDYYGIDLSTVKSGAGYADAAGYTLEALVIEADGETADEIEALLSEHLESLKAQFRSYDPDALKLAENAVFERDGGVIVLIVSPDAQAMLKTLRSIEP